MTDDEWLADAEARCAAATTGPWESDGKIVSWLDGEAPACAVRYHWPDDERVMPPVCMCAPHESGKYRVAGTCRPLEDAAFIAAARTDLPRALAMVRTLYALHTRLLAALEALLETGEWHSRKKCECDWCDARVQAQEALDWCREMQGTPGVVGTP